MRFVGFVVFVLACNGKASAPATGGGSGSTGSAPAAVVASGSAAPVDAPKPPPGKLELDDEANPEYALAFGKPPRLPAVSADGTLIATFESDAGGPMVVYPLQVSIRALDGTNAETIEIVDYTLANASQEEWSTKPPPEAVIKKLRDRAAFVMKRLEGFQSLVPIETKRTDDDVPQPTKIGDLTFKAVETDDVSVTVTLTSAQGRVARRATDEGYTAGSGDNLCSFRPRFGYLSMDQAKTRLYVAIAYKWRDDCGMPLQRYIVWDLPTPEEDQMAKLVGAQFDAKVDTAEVYAPGAVVVTGSELAPPKPDRGGSHTDSNLVMTMSSDRRSAWASVTTKLAGKDVRASSVLAKTPAGWRIVVSTWTVPVANATANADAKAGKLKSPPAFSADPGDASLRTTFDTLTKDGIADGATRGDLIAFGSGPGERTTTGAVLANGWNAGWKGKTTITSSIARLAPSGTTGWVAANVELSKGSYKIPFRIFAVFDKASSGQWTLVQMHFSV